MPTLKLSLIIALILSSVVNIYAQENRRLRVNGKEFQHFPRPPMLEAVMASCSDRTNRLIDGTCNNVSRQNRIEWGASDIALLRTIDTEYGLPDNYNDMGGQNRISPRGISNLICAQTQNISSGQNLSSFVFTWGQFLDHDISLTPEGNSEYYPIPLPANEPLFLNPIPFLRSEVHTETGESKYRQQSNLITSWIDASNVYGSENARAHWLRTFTGGKLKTSIGNLLPYNTLDGELNSEIDPDAPSMAGDGGGIVKTFVAGDIRAAEQPGLTALHTLFVREHNNICQELFAAGIRSDEELYQRARKHVGALIQNITYREFLPSLGVNLRRYRRYDPSQRSDISNLFATAAYRLGHTMVTDELLTIDNNCNLVDDGSISLLDGFFNPSVIAKLNIAPILKGLSIQVQNEVDPIIIDNLRNFLFGDPDDPNTVGLDLASLNIQRGRDHGLPDYNTVRNKYIGDKAKRFSDITSDASRIQALENAYGSVNNIDLWVGLLAEDLLPDASLGPTLRSILSTQFSALRDGDYFYFENDNAFDRRLKDRIKNTSLSDVIARNTSLSNLGDNVFVASVCGNPITNNRSSKEFKENILELNHQLRIYPSPASEFIDISLGDNIRPRSLRIVNTNGTIFYLSNLEAGLSKDKSIQINVTQYPEGIYFLQMTTEENQFSEKFVVVNK